MLKKILIILGMSTLLLLAESPLQGVTLSKAVFKEKTVWTDYQHSKRQMLPVTKTKKGDILVYVNQIVNSTAYSKKNVIVTNPIPYGTVYIRGTSSCEGSCEMLYSIDGGKSFKDSSALFVVYGKKQRVALGSEYTHIKYIFKTVLPVEKIRMAFKAVVK